jgi:solute carrier family 34 (sodium-dependent phosphate cotransporter)
MGQNRDNRLDPQGPSGSLVASADASAEASFSSGPAHRVEERRLARVVKNAFHFVAALFLFVLAIQLMKQGAVWIGFRLQASGLIDNAYQTLGLGWLGAYLVLSGSPIAATALTFHSTGAINELQTFAMLSGSRLGASFIVLLVGFL